MNGSDIGNFRLSFERRRYALRVEQRDESQHARLNPRDARLSKMMFKPENEIALFLSKYYDESRFCRDNLISSLPYSSNESPAISLKRSKSTDSCIVHRDEGISYVIPGEKL